MGDEQLGFLPSTVCDLKVFALQSLSHPQNRKFRDSQSGKKYAKYSKISSFSHVSGLFSMFIAFFVRAYVSTANGERPKALMTSLLICSFACCLVAQNPFGQAPNICFPPCAEMFRQFDLLVEAYPASVGLLSPTGFRKHSFRTAVDPVVVGPSSKRSWQGINIGKFCVLPLCTLIGNFRMYFNHCFSLSQSLFLSLLSCATGSATTGSTSSWFPQNIIDKATELERSSVSAIVTSTGSCVLPISQPVRRVLICDTKPRSVSNRIGSIRWTGFHEVSPPQARGTVIGLSRCCPPKCRHGHGESGFRQHSDVQWRNWLLISRCSLQVLPGLPTCPHSRDLVSCPVFFRLLPWCPLQTAGNVQMTSTTEASVIFFPFMLCVWDGVGALIGATTAHCCHQRAS